MPLHWDDFRFVLALGRAGSLGAAARLLKVEQSTVGRRLSALETELGVQLITRTPHGATLTEAGQAAVGLAESMDRGVEELIRKIGGEDRRPEGIVKLATTDTTAGFLMGGLMPLRESYPELHIELVVSNTAHDLMRREADVALRMFRETNPNLISRKIGDIGWSLYASPSFVERTGVALGPDVDSAALEGQELIGFSEMLVHAPGAVWLTAHSRPEDVVLRASSLTAVATAAKAGVGIAVLPCFVCDSPELIRLTPQVVTNTEAFLIIPPEHRDTVRVRIVMEAVAKLFEQERAMLAG